MYFLDITCKSIIGDNGCTELRAILMLMFVRTGDFFAFVYKSIPSTFLGAFTFFLFYEMGSLIRAFAAHM